MMPLPITLAYYTSTKQHFGFKDVYRATLSHLDRQTPLGLFNKVAHVEISPDELALGDEMKAYLEGLGFKVLTTVADWARGQSHQLGYMQDVVKLSKEPSVYASPYVLWAEDDQTITPHQCTATDLFLRSCQMLADDNELTSVRLLRASDLDTSPMVETPTDARFFHSPHFNYQWPLLRARDFYLAARFVEENPQAASTVQCEMLWRLILAPFSRSALCHRVWHPSFAESIHLGTPDYPRLKAELNL